MQIDRIYKLRNRTANFTRNFIKMHLFTSYSEWHTAITGPCGLTLSKEYCRERLAALADTENPSTAAFIKAYGQKYTDQVCEWFQQAESEATA